MEVTICCILCRVFIFLNKQCNEWENEEVWKRERRIRKWCKFIPDGDIQVCHLSRKSFLKKTTDSHSRRTGKWKVGTKRNLNPSPISSLISNSLLCSHFSISRFPWLVPRFPFHVLVTFGADPSRGLKNRCRYFKDTTSSITDRWSRSQVPAVAPVLDRFSSIFVCYLAAVGLKIYMWCP